MTSKTARALKKATGAVLRAGSAGLRTRIAGGTRPDRNPIWCNGYGGTGPLAPPTPPPLPPAIVTAKERVRLAEANLYAARACLRSWDRANEVALAVARGWTGPKQAPTVHRCEAAGEPPSPDPDLDSPDTPPPPPRDPVLLMRERRKLIEAVTGAQNEYQAALQKLRTVP